MSQGARITYGMRLHTAIKVIPRPRPRLSVRLATIDLLTELYPLAPFPLVVLVVGPDSHGRLDLNDGAATG